MEGSAAIELPVGLDRGPMLAFTPGEGETEVLEDMLALLEEILEPFPAVSCGAAS